MGYSSLQHVQAQKKIHFCDRKVTELLKKLKIPPSGTFTFSASLSSISHLAKYSYDKLYIYTRVGTLIVATIYLQLIQNRYIFQSFTVLQCSRQHCVQPVASDVEVVGYL